jgi:CRP-like cAMP-binding protein
MNIDEIQCMQAMSIFDGVDKSKLKLLSMAGTRLTFDVGQPITIQGNAAKAAYIILEGQAEVRGEIGDAVVKLALVERGSIVGELGIFLDQPYSATIVPITPVTALQVERDDLLALVGQVPQFAIGIIRHLSRIVIKSNDRYAKAFLS